MAAIKNLTVMMTDDYKGFPRLWQINLQLATPLAKVFHIAK